MKRINIPIVLLILSFNSFGVCINDRCYLCGNRIIPDTISQNSSLPKNLIYIEFLGPTQYIFSLNYERTLYSYNVDYVSLRIGINNKYYHSGGYEINIPLCVNYLHHIENMFFFEIGTGLVWYYERNVGSWRPPIYFSIYYNTNIGFGFIIKKHFLIRPSLNYIYTNKLNSIELWPGFSLGFAF